MPWMLASLLVLSLGLYSNGQFYPGYQTFRTWQPPPDYSPRPENPYNRGGPGPVLGPSAPHRPPWQAPPPSVNVPAYRVTQAPVTQAPDPSVCSPQTCQLPDCHCASLSAPNNLDKAKVPQIVMFTFDDAVNEQVIDYYKQLFPPERTNPNGCPISATFFVSHNWTDYNMVKQLYLAGHEIASHSITHRMPQSWWMHASYQTLQRELSGQRDNIVHQAGVPKSEVRGVRVPFLQIGGDTQFQMMQDEGFEYDASFMTGPHADGGLWPYTLDFVPTVPTHCSNMNCPKKTYPGMWEVPLNRWTGPSGHPCAMVDSCNTQPSGKGEALSYLWQNFNKQYYGNKAPVGVNMHAVWFNTATYLEAMQEYIQTLVEMDDVYIVTVQQTLEWMRDPRPLEDVKEWEPWMSSCQGKKKLVKMVPKTEDTAGDPMKKGGGDSTVDPMKPIDDKPEEQDNKRNRPDIRNRNKSKEDSSTGGREGKNPAARERMGEGVGSSGEKPPNAPRGGGGGRIRGRAGMTDEQGGGMPRSSASSFHTVVGSSLMFILSALVGLL